MIGIIGALDEEIEILKNNIVIKEISDLANCKYISGTYNDKDLVVTKCGMGKVNAALCTANMIANFAPEIIINTGVGGSLDSNLKVLDVTVAKDIVQHDYDLVPLGYLPAQVDKFTSPYFKCDDATNNKIIDAAKSGGFNIKAVRFATGDKFIENPDEKVYLASTFNASVCDMESGAIAQVCALSGIKFATIRTISDSSSGTDGAMEFNKFLKCAAEQSVYILQSIIKSY